MGIQKTEKKAQSRGFYGAVFIIFVMSVLMNSSFRGIVHDEAIGTFRGLAGMVSDGHPLLDIENEDAPPENTKGPARLIYIVMIALGYTMFGKTLLAFHFFPYLLQVLNPCLFFLIAFRFFRSVRWGLIAAFLYIIEPFNLAFLNLPDSAPVFVFFLLLLIMAFDGAREQPRWLLVCGIMTSLLILTRFSDGVIFGSLLYGIYCMYRWKSGIPWKWILASFGLFLGTQGLFAWLFGFPFLYPLYYLPFLLQRQANYALPYSFVELTVRAIRIFYYWFFGGKFLTPVLAVFLIVGAVIHLKKRIIHPLVLFVPYLGFTLFVYNGRYDAAYLPGATFLVPGFLLILLTGMQTSLRYVVQRLPQELAEKRQGPLQRSVIGNVITFAVLIVIIGGFARASYSLLVLIEDSMPISTMWRIIKYNPPFPGNPSYQESYIQLSPEDQLPVMLREQIIQAVRGNYRSWYLHRTGKDAIEQGFVEQARSRADFSYVDDYETTTMWETDRHQIEGSSSLWSEDYPGHIGAFPTGKSGTFIYKFDFPKPIETLTLADMHTQWGFHDVTKMWTSTDGEHWTLRCYNWNVHYRKDYYYQFFDEEFDGQTSVFIKYYFKAGDRSRADHDNRGASLQEFSLAATFSQENTSVHE